VSTGEDRTRAAALLDQARSRGAIKRLALDVEADPALRTAIIDEGRRRGAHLPVDCVDWPAKRLLRVARGLEGPSRQRQNPIARDEGFACMHCGAAVGPHGRTARDHCPRCLHSQHVDRVPGDRAADCGGLLVPVSAERRGEEWILHYRCAACGASRRNRALLDGDPPDAWSAIVALTSSP